jgi:RIO-like serine/threonine protein kinase
MQESERDTKLLKADLFGRVERMHLSDGEASRLVVRRDTRCARWWVRPLARYLAHREARALRVLQGMERVPQLISWGNGVLVRTWLPGLPMQEAKPDNPEYFAAALRILIAMHRIGLAHNDLAKEPNWLVDPEGLPLVIDFQLASVHRRRRRWFKLQAREDLRHFFKHKRTYCPDRLSERELRILASPSTAARLWRITGKRVYLWITRGVLGWSDREGAGNRETGPH